MSTAAQQVKIRRIILTGAVTAITVTGALYGAGLKSQSEMKQAVQQRREASPAERIAQLEEQRGALVAKKMGLERKLKELELRAKGATREESMVGMERRR